MVRPMTQPAGAASGLFTEVKRTRSSDDVVTQIRDAIIAGRLKTGDRLPNEPQADHLGSALEALLRFRHATVQELAEFRVSFEGETARWAAQRGDEADVAHLKELADRFTELAKEDGLPWRVLVEIDLAFHEGLAEASKNAVRVGIMLGIHRALHEASSSLAEHASAKVRRQIGTELRQIASAVAAHDAPRAARLTRRHVKKFSEPQRAGQEEAG